jgi:hypothetical protein
LVVHLPRLALGALIAFVINRPVNSMSCGVKNFPPRSLGQKDIVVIKDLVRIESIEVGTVPLVSSHSYVQSVGFRVYRPLFRWQRPTLSGEHP